MAMSSTILSANVMLNKLNGKVESIKSSELASKLEDGSVNVLDVREEAEFFISAIPGSVNIPMNELEARVNEIEKDKETLIVVCKVGKRAFLSYQKLKNMGFTNLKILEGGTCAYPYKLV
jgi:rhodanese-related sulfurtransferase